MVSVAQLVEHLVVAQAVVGSNPITHPKNKVDDFLSGFMLRLKPDLYGFLSDSQGTRPTRPHRLVVRTRDFRSRNRGSTPLGVTLRLSDHHYSWWFSFAEFELPITPPQENNIGQNTS